MPSDKQVHTYCLRCGRETVDTTERAGTLTNHCRACHYVSPRALIIDPTINWWLGSDGEYWHESGGMFVCNRQGQFLFMERTRFPSGLTVPSGHIDKGEAPRTGIRRETHEEVGFLPAERSVKYIATGDVVGDQCRRGADAHRWHAFATKMPQGAIVKVNPREGIRQVWLTLERALKEELPYVIRLVINKHGRDILNACR